MEKFWTEDIGFTGGGECGMIRKLEREEKKLLHSVRVKFIVE